MPKIGVCGYCATQLLHGQLADIEPQAAVLADLAAGGIEALKNVGQVFGGRCRSRCRPPQPPRLPLKAGVMVMLSSGSVKELALKIGSLNKIKSFSHWARTAAV